MPLEGAGILVMADARPMIKNCLIRNNIVEAGDGGNGVRADDNNNAGRGGWGGWAHGAGLYCAPYSAPRIVNCRIENNRASGGNGGNGGNYATNGGTGNYGGNWSTTGAYNISSTGITQELVAGNLWEVWDWDYASYWAYLSQGWITVGGTVTSSVMNLIIRDPNAYQEAIAKTSYIGDYRWYSGYGGGAFCDIHSNVVFEHCEIRGNRVFGGMSGQGGTIGPGGRTWEPLVPFELPSFGAGVYCAADAQVRFRGCTFEDNMTSVSTAGTDPNHRLDPYIGLRRRCLRRRQCARPDPRLQFRGQPGGHRRRTLHRRRRGHTVEDCNVTSNRALRGGGFAGVGGSIRIEHCDIRNNDAADDPNDATDNTVTPAGGGIFCLSANAQILDCNVASNSSLGSGGGIYLRGENAMTIDNCLIVNNVAYRDGGGLTTVWYAKPTIQNCTFVGNVSPGVANEPNITGLGGAVFCSYESECTIIDSILWRNLARAGNELALSQRLQPGSTLRQAQRFVQQYLGRAERRLGQRRLPVRIRHGRHPRGPAVCQRTAGRLLSGADVCRRRTGGPEPVCGRGQHLGRQHRHVAIHDADGQRAGHLALSISVSTIGCSSRAESATSCATASSSSTTSRSSRSNGSTRAARRPMAGARAPTSRSIPG